MEKEFAPITINGFKLHHGMRVSCTIDGGQVDDAEISLDGDDAPYICQNDHDGNMAKDKLGYDYSWTVAEGLDIHAITNFKCIDPEKRSWWLDVKKGDELTCMQEAKPNPDGTSIIMAGGAGFEPNKKFIVRKVDVYTNKDGEKYAIFFPTEGHGIYSNSVIPTTQFGEGLVISDIEFLDEEPEVLLIPEIKPVERPKTFNPNITLGF